MSAMKLNREYQTGDVVEVVTAAAGEPALPAGLGAGFQVRVVRFGDGGDMVERDGREWRVPFHHLRPRSGSRRK